MVQKNNGKINKCGYCGNIIKKDKKFEKMLKENMIWCNLQYEKYTNEN